MTQSVMHGTPEEWEPDTGLCLTCNQARDCRTLGVETVHHALNNVQLVLNGKVDEVCVDQYVIGRTKLCVVAKEQGRGDLWSAPRQDIQAASEEEKTGREIEQCS